MHVRQLVSRKIDGMILAHDPNLEFPKSLSLVADARIPAVFLFSAAADIRADAVLLDEQAGVQQVMRYLFSPGHRRIAFGRPVSGDIPHPREKFFLEYMQRNGVSVPEHFLIPFESTDNAHCRQTLQRVLAQTPAPTAIFAGNDRVALIVLTQLAALGVDVPRAMSVVGFDNQRFIEHLPVPLTTVDQPKRRWDAEP
jgi:DNA-binding LacI/PurR family transcriptional regulator